MPSKNAIEILLCSKISLLSFLFVLFQFQIGYSNEKQNRSVDIIIDNANTEALSYSNQIFDDLNSILTEKRSKADCFNVYATEKMDDVTIMKLEARHDIQVYEALIEEFEDFRGDIDAHFNASNIIVKDKPSSPVLSCSNACCAGHNHKSITQKIADGFEYVGYQFGKAIDNMKFWEEEEAPRAAAPMMMTETLPAGTLIIAMDNTNQDNSSTRVRQAYGLAVRLLHAEVPLKWIINPSKTSRTATDLSASVTRVSPAGGGSGNRNFVTGPIAVFPGFETQAMAVINSFGNGIRVYSLNSAVNNVPIHSNLTHKPTVLVEPTNSGIHTGIMSAAGMSSGTHYSVGSLTGLNASSCVTMVSAPHQDGITTAQRNGARDFVQNGGNFYAQCAAVRGFQASAPRVFLNAGFRDEPGISPFLYDNPQEPSAQFEGTIPDEGGSLEDFGFNTEPPGGTRIVHDNSNDYKFYAGPIDGFMAAAGGYVHYMGGHDHDGDIDSDRTYLNAVLRSADRPQSCGLNLGPIAVDDNGMIDCDNPTTVVNVLANDSDPLGNGLTVNLIGSGSNGTFTNNGNGMIMYTGNVNGNWQGDQITYEACSGSVCSQATLTITSTNPTQNTISGTVFEDTNGNMVQNGSETGPSGVTVQLFETGNMTPVQTTTTTSGGGYSFTVTPPPTCPSGTLLANADSFTAQEDANENYGTCDEVGLSSYSGNFDAYAYARFDLSGVSSTCPVVSAQFIVTHTETDDCWGEGGSSTAFSFEARRVTGNWTEGGITWNNQPGNTGSYGTQSGSPSNSGGTNYTFNVTSLVQDWLSGTTNNGIVLVPVGSPPDGYFSLFSNEANPSQGPRLVITYGSPPGGNDYEISVVQSSLPTGATFTTDNLEVANFNGAGQLDCNNDFGYELACASDPTVNLSSNSGNTCVTDAITVSNNTFGGSATSVTITENGAGSVSPTSANSSPFNWTYTPAPGDAGNTVTITVTTNNPAGAPCTPATATYTLTVNDNPNVTLNLGDDQACEDETSVTLTGGSPGGGSYSGTGVMGNMFNPSSVGPGTYTITYSFMDSNGCDGSATDDIVVSGNPPAPVVDVNCAGGPGNAVVTVTSPTGSQYEYSLDGGPFQSNNNFSGVAQGNHSITVRDTGTGCETMGSNFNVNCACPDPATVTLSAAMGSTCGTDPVTISNNTFGGSATSVTITDDGAGSVSPGSSNSSPFNFTYTPTAADAGNTVTITVTTNNPLGAPCTPATATYTLQVNSNPNVTLNLGDDDVCADDMAITLTGGSPSGGTYSGPGVMGNMFNPSSAGGPGTYTITYEFMDGNGCEGSATDDIVVSANPPAPVVDIDCSGGPGSAVVTVTSPTGGQYQYRLDNGSFQGSTTFNNVAQGNHTITVLDTNTGCETTGPSFNVNCNCPDPPTVDFAANMAMTCSMDAVMLSGNTFGGNATNVTLTHDGDGVLSPSSFNSSPFTFTYTPAASDAGNTITITATTNNPFGAPCTAATDQFTISVYDNPAVPTVDVDCSGGFGNATVNVTGPLGSEYEYQLNNGLFQSSPSFTGVLNGSYMVTVRNTMTGCMTMGPTFSVDCGCPNSPTLNLNGMMGSTCVSDPFAVNGNTFGGSATMVTITHDGAGSVNPTSASSSPFNFTYTPGAGDANMLVTITVTTDNPLNAPCNAATQDYFLTVNPLPNVTFDLADDSACASDTSVPLSGGNPAGGTYSGPGVTGSNFNPTAAGGVGTYTITYEYTDDAGCVSSATDDITVSDDPASPDVQINCTGGSGNGVITVTNPVGPQFEYSLNGGAAQSSATFSGLADGTYTVTVINTSTGCSTAGNSTILDCNCPNPPGVNLNGSSGTTCELDPFTVTGNSFLGSASQVTITHNGAGSVSPTSANGSPFDFTYNPAAADIGNVVTITVTSNNPLGPPCMVADATYSLTVSANPSVTLNLNTPTACVDDTSVPLSGGTPAGGTYSGPGVTGSNFSPAAAGGVGTYPITYTFTDANGCVNSATDDIVVNDLPAAANINIDCSGGPGNGVVTVISPTGSQYEYSLDGGTPQASVTFNNVTDGNHVITVIDTNTGCDRAGSPFNVDCNCPNQPLLSLAANGGVTCNVDPITVSGNSFGGSATQVSLVHDGNGTLSPAGASSSPFNFTYTPVASDVGNNVTITVTTNNPLGAPCAAATADYVLEVRALPNVVLNLGDNQACIDETSVALTGGTPAGGTYSGTGVTGGVFNPSVAGIGTTTITYTFVDSEGCTNSDTDDIVVSGLPPAPAIDINCAGGPGNGIITVTTPLGAQYEYSLDGGAAQASPTFNNVADGTHNITVIDVNTGCQTTGSNFVVDCNCPNPTIIMLSSASGLTCNVDPITVNGNTFGGSATEVALSHDGNGTLVPVTTTVSPFSFTYTPAASDVGNVVTITATTNNPLGPPCSEASTTYSLTVRALPNVVLNLGDDEACVDETSVVLTGGTPAGGTYSGTAVTAGVFNPSVAGVGTTTITYTFIDSEGCENSATDDIEVYDLPSEAIVDINCDGGPGNGIVTVTAPLGTQYEYRLDGGAAQSSPVFNNVSDATHTVTVVNVNTTCEFEGAPFVVDCNCPDPTTLTLSANSGLTCNVDPITVNGNTFGGSATEVALTHDGNGTLAPLNTTISPFSFTYTPVASDVGNLVTITVTTNNPIGLPCTPAVETYALTVQPLPTVVLNLGDDEACVNETSIVLSGGTPAGGVYSGTAVTAGVFNPSVAGVGTTTITYTYTDPDGCVNSDTDDLEVYDLPAEATVDINCDGGPGTGIVTVTSPLGPQYEYRLDGGAAQPSPVFNNVSDAMHTITVVNVNTTCEFEGAPFEVDCNCPFPPVVTLSADRGVTCQLIPFVQDGNTFGGDVTQVTITHDGTGTVTPMVASSSPFSFTYTPTALDAGTTVTITFTTDNTFGLPCMADVATFELDILPTCLVPDINQTMVNTPVDGDVSTNDNFVPGSMFMIVDTDPNGSIVMDADGTYVYTPNTNFVGTSYYTYKVCSPAAFTLCDTTTLTIEVRPEEVGPENTVIAQDDTNTTPLNTPVTSCILCNDSDPQGDNIGAPVQQPGGDIPAGSTVVFNPDGTVTYTPPTDFVGIVTIPYEICDDGIPQACDQANLIIDVLPIEITDNTTYANDDAYVIMVDEVLNEDVSLNDNDPQGDNVTWTLVPGTEENGTVTVNPDGTFEFTPDPGYVGPAQFVYSACDDGTPVACDMATAYITIHEPYIEADPDINQTLVNTPVSGDVSTNDEAPVGSMFMIVDTDPNGTIVLNADGTYDYTPNTNFVGTSFYTYKVCAPDAFTLCDTTTLTIEVRPEEVGPENTVIAQDDHNTTPLNTPVTSCILCNDSDPQGDNIGAPVQQPGGDIPAGSTVVFNPDGTVTYTPPTDFVGVVTIPYEICDDGTPVACDQANLIIDIVPLEIGYNTTYANDDAYTILVDEVLNDDVSLNDNDPQGDNVTFTLVPGTEENGTVNVNGDGTFAFTPDPGYVGPATFIYSACDDGTPQACDTATVYITIHEPYIEADPDINQTLVNTPVSGDVSTNDEAPVGSMFMIVDTDPNGTIVLNADGTYDYTPNPNFVGTSFYTYKVCAPDAFTLCDTTTLTIEVRPEEIGPENTVIAQDDHNTTPLNTPVTSCILCNDSDPQGDNLGSPTQQPGGDIPAGSTVVFNPDGTVTFTPPTDFVGVVTIPYEVCDDGTPIACDQANLIIDVVPEEITFNTTYANDDAYTILVNEKLSANVSLNDNDPQGDNTTFAMVPGTAENGTVMLDTDGTFMFTPDPGYVGPATFQYEVCDDGTPVACDIATVYITIHAPYIEADPDINQTLVNTPVSGDVSTNDEAPEGSMFMIVDTDPNGTIVLNADGTYDYTPNTNFVGTSFYTYKVCAPDDFTVCDTTTLTIEVRPEEVGPENTVIAQDDHNTTPLNTPVTSCILCNDSDPQGDNLGTPTQQPGGDIPAGSTVDFNADGTVTFTPPTDFVGVVTIPYEVCDDGIPQACDQANLIIDVVPEEITFNTTYANDDAYTILVDEKLSADVSLNDNDPQGDNTTFTMVPGTAENGTVMLDTDGTFMFTPDPGYTGPATFQYEVCDDGTPVACDTATVYITIHEPYIEADPDINQTLVNTPVSGDVSTNDEAPVGSVFTIVDTDPNGTIVLNPDGTYDYTPNNNFVGTSFYTYEVCAPDGFTICDTTTLTIEVRPEEVGPMNTIIAQDDHNTTPLNTPVTSCILCNDNDPQGDNIGDPVQLPGGDIPAGSTVDFNPDGTVTFTPPTDFIGVVTIPYEICDDGAPQACDQANLIIDVVPLDPVYNTTYANDDAYITLVDEKLSADVSLNDNDPQGDNVTFTMVPGTAENGTVMLDTDGTFMFTPDPGYTGPATFLYSACDDGTPQACDTATVYITVHAPYIEADPDINQTLVNTPVSGDVSTNDEAPEGSVFTIVDTDPNGTIVLNPDGTYDYTPNTNFVGTSFYTYEVCAPDAFTTCDTTTLTIEVRPEEVGPENTVIAQDDHNTTPLNTPVTSCILCNDSDPQGDNLGDPVQLPGGDIPAGSTVVFNPDGTVTYTPPTNFVGVVTIPYEVCDDGYPQACDQANLIIDVTQEEITFNTTYANDDAYTILVDEKLSADVSLNDNDPQGDNTTFTMVPGTAENGTVMLDTDGTFMFTPDPDYTGPATFQYSVCDDGTPVACDTATVYITIHEPYIDANPDINQTVVNTPVTGDVSTNDEAPEGSIFTIVDEDPNGTIVLNPDGTYEYTPNTNFVGTSYYTYEVCSPAPSVRCDTTTLTIEVRPEEVGPENTVIAQDDTNTTPLGTPVTSCILCNDSDPQGDNLGDPVQLPGGDIPAGSTVVFNPDGTVTYTPPADFVGVVTIPYEVCDDGYPQACDQADLIIDVEPLDPTYNTTYANDDAYTILVDEKLNGDVSLNDNDPQGDDVMFTIVAGSEENGTVMLDMDGTFMFMPEDDYTGPATFVYSVCDKGTPEACDTATVYITIHEPYIEADPDINQTVVNTPVTGDVSTNDEAPEGSIFTIVDEDPNGTIVLNPDGTYEYTPNTNFVGTSYYTYEVCSPAPSVRCDTTTLTIEVRAEEIGPENTIIAQDDTNTTPLGTPVVSCILCNDSDPQGDDLGDPVQLPGGDIPDGSTVVFNPDGTVTFTPPDDFIGVVTIPYEVCDDGYPQACDQADLIIDVVPLDPMYNTTYGNDDAYTILVDEKLNGDVSLNDNDPQGDDVMFTVVAGSEENGTVMLDMDGTFMFMPDADYTGPATFIYSVCDKGTPEACDTATVYITIHEPYVDADPDINQTIEDTPVTGDVSTNDEAPEGSIFTIVTEDPNGTIELDPDGTYVYTPDPGFIGTSTYTYEVCSPAPSVRCDTTTLTIEVTTEITGPDNSIIAQDDTNTTPLNNSVTSCVLCNDSDPQFDPIGLPVLLPGGDIPAGSTVVVNPDSTITFTPPVDFVGVVTIPYEICDEERLPQACDQANLIIDVVPLPLDYNTTYGNDDAYITLLDEKLNGDVSLNDYDPQGDDVMFTLVEGSVLNGDVMLNMDGTFMFTPPLGYTGPAQFVYSVCDKGTPEACDTATVYISVHIGFGTIGDFVWKDLDGDGIQDENEPGIEGVVATLYTCEGEFVDVQRTDATGYYIFEELFEGYYYATFDLSELPPGCAFTLQDQGDDDTVDSDVNLLGTGPCVLVLPGVDIVDYDAGVLPLASIGDFVWDDINGNGIQDSGEPGIEDVEVRLYNENDQIISTTTSGADGFYLIDNIYPGNYYAEFITPDGYELTFPFMGNNVQTDSNVDGSQGEGTTPIFRLSAGEVELSIDAGFYRCIEIGELVWYDYNENNLYDPTENGVNGILVEIFRLEQDGYIKWDETYSGHKPGTPSDDGFYQFCVPPGQYYLKFNLDDILDFVLPNVGSFEEIDSDVDGSNGYGTTASFTVFSGEQHLDYGAGILPFGTLGDRVWLDENEDGRRDEEEPGVPDIGVDLIRTSDHTVVQTQVTDEDGLYKFEEVIEGEYYLRFEYSADYHATNAHAADDDRDSDVDHSFGNRTTATFRVREGEHTPHVDAGLTSNAGIVLPVDWHGIEVENKGNYHQLDWQIATEINISHYEIERRLESEDDFVKIGEVLAADNNYDITNYSMKDYDVIDEGIYYYRVKQISFANKIAYSQIVFVERSAGLDREEGLVSLYPNPAVAYFNIDLIAEREFDELKLGIFDSDGKLVMPLQVYGQEIEMGKSTYTVDIQDLAPGMYSVKVMLDKYIVNKKLIVIK